MLSALVIGQRSVYLDYKEMEKNSSDFFGRTLSIFNADTQISIGNYDTTNARIEEYK